ncbi:hypothetical protein RHO12_03805 [Orbus sturtevantii]|uniref:hypothetical protein n=1 Tax=Orbus sturtevantii TaxID=3074109 RepID=UPI00370D744E
MTCGATNTSAQNLLTVIPFTYQSRYPTKRYYMQEKLASYHANSLEPLIPDEIIEQCLALVYAMLEVQHHGVRESLTLILQERLQLLQDKLS